jgi:hypothetical protein
MVLDVGAVLLFRQWGFLVEPGPGPEEVTLIVEGPDYRTYSVHDVDLLPQMAMVALQVGWANGAWGCPMMELNKSRQT